MTKKTTKTPAPTVAELAKLLGRRGRWVTAPGVTVDVVIRDAKPQYGHLLYLVEAVAGSGTTWVRATSVILLEEEGV